MRLDIYLHISGLARSRTHAANLIKLGKITVDGLTATKASYEINANSLVEVSETNSFASLGGIKLNKALDDFGIDLSGKTAIDIGASNGGFTDVLLRRGAHKVFAVDVGQCALPKELAEDDRVCVKDKINARYINFEDIGIFADIITIDVSFISLKLVIPSLLQFLRPSSAIVALVKPQFEVGKKSLTKSGIVQNKKQAEGALKEIASFCAELGLTVVGTTQAPRPFESKNQEYFIYCLGNRAAKSGV